jgi:hypothetical protein
MKAALLSIFGLSVGRSRRDSSIHADRGYCSCGALMPLERRKAGASIETEPPLQGVIAAGK